MSTKIPWFRYGFKETKRWLRKLYQQKTPIKGEIGEALNRCNRQNIRQRQLEEDEEINELIDLINDDLGLEKENK